MRGLMQDRPLALPHVFHRAEQLFGHKTLVTATADGEIATTIAEWARARAPARHGARHAGRPAPTGGSATFCWNTASHLELYLAAPCTGRVLHTLNIRLFPEQLVYIANHAEDDVVFVDRSLLPVLHAAAADKLRTVRHVVVIDDGADCPIPDGRLDYETLLAAAEPFDGRFDVDDENSAAAMCYTLRHHRQPEGRGLQPPLDAAALADLADRRTGRRSRSATSCMPVVPMFHANAWGLPVRRAAGRVDAWCSPGPNMTPKAIVGAAGAPPRHGHRGRADDLDGRAAAAAATTTCPRCGGSSAAARPCRGRCRRPTGTRSACRSCTPGA